MALATWLIYCTASAVTAFTPGPAVLLAISNAAGHGRKSVLLSSAGNALGIFLVSGLAMLGLGAVLRTSAILFTAVKLAGAAYLIYLGVRMWLHTGTPWESTRQIPAEQIGTSLFKSGLLIAITNPKSVLFFTAFFPPFISAEQPVFPQYLLLTASFVAMTLLSHLCYVLILHRMMRALNTRRKILWANRSFGLGFITLGLAVSRLRQAQ
jgi:threonine/homoserine/homoserine lactone efflux protein